MKTIRECCDILRISDKRKYYFAGLVSIWAVLFVLLVYRGPIETDSLAYLQEDKVVHRTAILDGLVGGDQVRISLDLKTLKTNDVDYAKMYGAFARSIKKASQLPLSENGFKVIVRADLSEYLLREGELERDEYFQVKLQIMKAGS